MRDYKKILSIDFEMYNSMHYWSICWIGAALSGRDLNAYYFLERKVNPIISYKLTGGSLDFPFTFSDLKKCPKFGEAAFELFRLIEKDTLVVGHAIDNDVKMLLTACGKNGLKCPDFEFLDTNLVYCGLTGRFAQCGLSGLADAYHVEFSAHNPKEDAAAALAVTKAMLEEKGLTLFEAIEKFGITLGAVSNGLVKKCSIDCMSANAKEHINNYNSVFFSADSPAQGDRLPLAGKRVAIEHKLATHQNMRPLVQRINILGGKMVTEGVGADLTVSSKIDLGKKDSCSLLEFAFTYGFGDSDVDKLDFYPAKITDQSGNPISYVSYLKSVLKLKGGIGVKYCFDSKIERSLKFVDFAARALKGGGNLCSSPCENSVFVVAGKDRLADESDYKIRKFKELYASGKAKVITLKEFELQK